MADTFALFAATLVLMSLSTITQMMEVNFVLTFSASNKDLHGNEAIVWGGVWWVCVANYKAVCSNKALLIV